MIHKRTIPRQREAEMDCKTCNYFLTIEQLRGIIRLHFKERRLHAR